MTAFWENADSAGRAAIIAATIAVIGVIISAIVSLSIARSATYINSVTVERSKWIDNLRRNLSTFLGSAAYLNHKMRIDMQYLRLPEHDDLVRELETLDALIRLQLNPSGVVDKNIIVLIEDIPGLADKPLDSRFKSAHRLLIRHSQWLLKDEWVKVKFESSGPVRRLLALPTRWRRQCGYSQFCDREGSLEVLKNKLN
jgi:hypothetical protein